MQVSGGLGWTEITLRPRSTVFLSLYLCPPLPFLSLPAHCSSDSLCVCPCRGLSCAPPKSVLTRTVGYELTCKAGLCRCNYSKPRTSTSRRALSAMARVPDGRWERRRPQRQSEVMQPQAKGQQKPPEVRRDEEEAPAGPSEGVPSC